MTNFKLKILNFKKGFTLVETLVAVAILSLSILATFTAVQGGLQASLNAKDKVTAYYLAQEGMEYIRNVRDDNALNVISGGSNTWLTTLSASSGDPCYFGKTCRVDSTTKTATDCANDGATCAFLKQNSSTGLYGYASGTNTQFIRSIQFQSINSNEILVTITISWTSRGLPKSFQVTESLFNRE